MPLPYNSVLGILTEGLLGGAGAEEDGLGGVGADCASTPAATRLYWALDVDLAGIVYHFATSDVEVDGIRYSSGLGEQTLSKVIDVEAAVSLVILTANDWPARFRAAQWLVDGGAATLWLVEESSGGRRRREWLRGTIAVTGWRRAGEALPAVLRGTRLGFQLPNIRGRVDPYTQPEDPPTALDTGYSIYVPGQGQYYPLIIGYPGYDDTAGVVYPVVPAPVIMATYEVFAGDPDAQIGPADSLGNIIVCVAAGVIDANEVTIQLGLEVTTGYDTSTGERTYALAADYDDQVEQATDKIGQVYQFIETHLGIDAGGAQLYQGEPRPYIGFSPAADHGGGILHRGEVMRGAADIAEWAIQTYTALRFDEGRHRASAAKLNEYHFDTWVNTPQNVIEWLNDAVVQYAPALIVVGDQGVFLQHIPTAAGEADVVLDLEEGRNCEFVELVSNADDDVVNELMVWWAPTRDLSTFFQARLFTSEHQRPVTLPHGGTYYDTRATGNALARVSQQQWSVRTGSLELPTVWEAATAYKIAQDRLLLAAMPVRRLRYTVGIEQHVRMPGEIVRLTDASMSIEGMLCVIEDVRVSTSQVELALRPIRTLENYL